MASPHSIDKLTAEVPLVLKTEVYAVASLLGATIIITANAAQVQGSVAEIIAAIIVFVVRMVSVWKGWKIPIARSEQ